jgi:hypothetical protein
MSNPVGHRFSYLIILYDYNLFNQELNMREEGVCDDGDEQHLFANRKFSMNVLVKFDRQGYDPTM